MPIVTELGLGFRVLVSGSGLGYRLTGVELKQRRADMGTFDWLLCGYRYVRLAQPCP